MIIILNTNLLKVYMVYFCASLQIKGPQSDMKSPVMETFRAKTGPYVYFVTKGFSVSFTMT